MEIAVLQLFCLLVIFQLNSQSCLGRPAPPGFRASSLNTSCQPLLFIFGSSIADTGQYSAAMPYLSSCDFPPYGVDYFSEPAGRWSNGRVFTDFISQGLGYGLIDPFLKSVNANFTHGANFATASSTARDLDYAYMFPLSVQISQFQEYLSDVLKTDPLSQDLIRHQIEEAVFLFETGLNDYGYQMLNSTDFDVSNLVEEVLAAMETALKRLYSTGGRNFIVMNLSPVGCAPYARTVFSSYDKDEYGCIAFVNAVHEMHNSRLEELLSNLTAELADANWILFNSYSIFIDAYHNPEKYGIEHPFEACCGAGGEFNYIPSIDCGSSGYVNGTLLNATRCDDPSLYVIWDFIHPVESFAKIIADGVLSGEYLVPPFDITTTCSSHNLTAA